MDHDQLFKAVLMAQLAAFLELFFPELAAQFVLTSTRFVDKELFSAPPMGPGREVDLLAEVDLRDPVSVAGAAGKRTGATVAVWIEIQAQRDPEFVWRHLEYYALLQRIRGWSVLPLVLSPDRT